MYRQNEKNRETEVVNTEARDTTLSKLLSVYILVCAVISGSWAIGHYQCSFLWVFLLIAGLFVLWKTKLTNIVQNRLYQAEISIHRKRALRQSETAEWLNFIFNRWWVFNADTIEELIKKRLEDRLFSIKPSYLDSLQLQVFTFGDHTPSIKYVRTFEYADGVPGGRKPVSWVNINSPPTGLDKVSSYQIVCEVETQNLLDQFQMVFAAKVGRGRASLGFQIAVEQLRIAGNLQIVLYMSKDIAFPHISRASLSFMDKPEVHFNLNVLKAVNLTELPMLKVWIYDQVMDGLAKAMVDPGQIDIPIARAGAVQMQKPTEIKPQKLAQGVLTIHVLGTSVRNGNTEDVRYSTFRLGDQKRTTHDELAINDWDDICSFFVYNLKREKLVLKSKCHRLLSNVTLQKHIIDLSSLPLDLRENYNVKIENNDGSTYELRMQYTSLPRIELDKEIKEMEPSENKCGVMYICVHGASNLISSDRGGSSDPYCVVFCDRRRILTTPFIKRTLFPRWDSGVEFFVKDFTNVTLSFYVFDWDGTNIIEDDFLGSAFSSVSEEEPRVIKKTLTLGYNKSSDGYVTDASYGQIIVSMVFRPVASVEKSEKFRVASVSNGGKKDYLYNEDLMSPSSAVEITPTEGLPEGGGPNHRTSKKQSLADVLPASKTMVDLTILQARDLVAMDRNGFSDPFCIVKMGEKRLLKTSVKKKTLFPKWNESTTFEVSDDNQMIEILMYDKDLISNDFLGKVMLSLDKLKEISYKNTPEWIKLQRTKSGMLQIKCTVTSNDIPMQRDSNGDKSPDVEVFASETTAALHSAVPNDKTEPAPNHFVRKDMKPDILPHHDQLDSGRHPREETEIIMKQESTLTSMPPPKLESHSDKSSAAKTPTQNGVQTAIDGSPSQGRQKRKSHSSPKRVHREDTLDQARNRVHSSTQQNYEDGQKSSPQQRKRTESSPEQSAKVKDQSRSDNIQQQRISSENLTRIQRRSRSSSQQMETSVDDLFPSPQNEGHRYSRHSTPPQQLSQRPSKEVLMDDSLIIVPEMSPAEVHSTTSPVQRGRRKRSNSDNVPLMRSQSDMNVNNKPAYNSFNMPDKEGMKHGDSMNSFTYRDQENSSIAPSSPEPSIISTEVSGRRRLYKRRRGIENRDTLSDMEAILHMAGHLGSFFESGSTINHDKMYGVCGEVKEVRGLPSYVTSFYCKIRLQNPHTKFKFGSNSRVIGKSSLVKMDNPVLNTKFEVDRGAGTNIDALLIFDIKDGRKQHVCQHSFTIGLLFMDYQEGGVTKWLKLGHGTDVEILINLTKGLPNPRLMRKKHNHSMRLPGEKKFNS